MKPGSGLRWLFIHVKTLPLSIARQVRSNTPVIAFKIFRTPSAWIFISFIFVYLVLIRYCSHAYYRDPTSAFFDPQRGYERRYSLQRQEQADRFIGIEDGSPLRPSTGPKPNMCIGIATIGRPGVQYVRNTIGSLLEDLTKNERKEIHLITLIAHTDPTVHPIYREKWLEVVSDEVQLYNVSHEQFEKLRDWENAKDYQRKAIFDYTYVLEKCLASGASWITMIEDDTLAMAGWYPRTVSALDKIDAQQHWIKNSDWLYLRLFYTEEFFGWNREKWPRYLASSMVVVFITALSLCCIRLYAFQKIISNQFVAIICLICTPACIVLYFMAGRLSMQSLAPGVHVMPNYGCCAQGFVFSREMGPKVVERLRQKEVGFVDVLIEAWANEDDLVRWAVVPSLLQHVGAHSSKGDDLGDKSKYNRSVAEKIWNFGFEMHKTDDF